MGASLAPQAKGLAARWIVPVALDADAALLAALARAAVAAEVALEWSLDGAGDLLAAADRACAATRAAGLARALVSVDAERSVAATRLVAARLRALEWDAPIVLVHRADEGASDDGELLHAAIELGALLCDGIGDAVALPVRGGAERAGDALALGYRILQGARQRTTWTEFISCPSCGRTLFDLEETTARIKVRTQHLKGVKIAIMGCIVNGPGEMADADFGYVGSGPGLVNLYVGHECVERHVAAADADARLIELIGVTVAGSNRSRLGSIGRGGPRRVLLAARERLEDGDGARAGEQRILRAEQLGRPEDRERDQQRAFGRADHRAADAVDERESDGADQTPHDRADQRHEEQRRDHHRAAGGRGRDQRIPMGAHRDLFGDRLA
jgi:hypothetical protein